MDMNMNERTITEALAWELVGEYWPAMTPTASNDDGTPATTTGRTYKRTDFSAEANSLIDSLDGLATAVHIATKGLRVRTKASLANAVDWWAERRRRRQHAQAKGTP